MNYFYKARDLRITGLLFLPMKTLSYYLVGVFTSKPFGGNPLAVFPDADDLSQDEMPQIAQELNLSETTFLQKAKNEGSD